MSNPPYPLGVFIGNPLAGDASVQASYAAKLQAFSTLMGTQPTVTDTYIDYTKPISQWLDSTTGGAWSMARTPGAKDMLPVIALPMSSKAAGSPSADQTYKNFAAGDYDSMLQAMVKGWLVQGFTTQYWRPGWEMNLNSVTWNYAGATAATQADWIAAFQHISTVLHAAAQADGVNLKVVWNPGVTNYSLAGVATKTLYPGNQYVDVIAADVYGGLNPYSLYDWDKNNGTVDSSLQQWASDPVNLLHYYNYPAATQYSLDGSTGHSLSLTNLLAFAKQQGKQVGIAETGAGADGGGITDNPTFVNWLSSTLASSGDTVDFVNIWDINSVGHYEFSKQTDDKPLEAAAWANDFGAQGVTARIQSSVLHFGASTDPVTGSPEAGVTGTLLDVSGKVLATAVSDANGLMSFSGLAAGTYQLRYTAPANQAIAPGSLADPTTGLTAQFMVGVGQTFVAPVGSMISVSSLTGEVLLSGAGDAGVPVALLNAAGTVVASTTTNASGTFGFTNLAAGSYQLQYSPVAGQLLAPGSQANVTTGLTAMFALGYGQPLTLPPEVFVPPPLPAAIKGSVVLVGAGTAPGAGEAGVTVSLFNSSGTLIGTTVSASDGSYAFTQLPAGSYDVGYSAPTGQAIEPGTAADPTTGLTATFAIAAGQTVVAPTGSLVSLGSISGQVVLTGAPRTGVAVSLLNAAGTVIATATTNAAGAFTFAGLLAGTYQVKYTKPAGLLWQVGGPATPATGLIPPVTLAYGEALSLPVEQFLTAGSQSFIQTSVQLYGGSAGTLWLGADPGVTVSLLSASGTVIGHTVSDKNGWLEFGALGAGTYQLQYTPPAGQALEPPTKTNPNPGLSAPVTVAVGQTASVSQEDLVAAASVSGQALLAGVGDPGVAVTLLTATGAVVATATTDTGGAFSFGDVIPGSYAVKYAAPQGQVLVVGSAANAGTGLTPTFALGIAQTLRLAAESLSNLGAIQAQVRHFASSTDPVSGSPEAGVSVTLEDMAANAIATTVSGTDGSVAFSQVASGTYQLLYAPPAGQAIEPGSLVDPTTDLTAPFAVAAGQTVTAPGGSMVSLSTLGGATLLSGAGEAGVAVGLLTAGGSAVATATTDATGHFTFSNVAAGSYQLEYSKPKGQVFQTGAPANPAGLTPSFAVTYGQALSLPPELLLTTAQQATIQATVLLYGDSTGRPYLGGDGGVGVALLNNAGTVIASTVTSGNGWFQFIHLAAGTYQLAYTPPAHQVIAAGGSVNTLTGLGPQLAVAAGQTRAAPLAAMLLLPSIGPGGQALATQTAELAKSAGATTPPTGGGQVFELNRASDQDITTITGFDPAADDVLDLQRTLAGTDILADLSNVARYVTAAVTGADTTLYVDPTGGGGAPAAFAVLSGVHVTVAQLQAAHEFSLG